MHIDLVTETFPPEINGVAMTLGRLSAGLAARGHRLTVVRPRQRGESGEAARHEMPGVVQDLRPGVGIPGYNGLRLGFPAHRHLRRRWQMQRPDIVHVATEGPLGWSALRTAQSLGIPVSSSYHTHFGQYAAHYGFGLAGAAVEGYLRRFHDRAAVTMVPSADVLRDLEQRGWTGCALWSRGVDTALFTPAKRSQALRAAAGVPEGGLLCLHVGRMAPEKDIPLAIEAFRRIGAVRPDARMVVVGDGPLRERLTREHPGIRFPGAVPVEDLAAWYASADLFLFPSRSETFGNVLMEAFASGLASVGFDYACARMHGSDGRNMRKVPFDDREAFLAAAEAVAVDDAGRAALGAAGRATAEGVGWAPVVDRFEELLRRAAAPAPAAMAAGAMS